MVLRSVVAFAAALLAGSAFALRDENLANPIVGVEDAVLTDAPNVPPPIHRSHATKVVVHLEVRKLEGYGLDPATGKGYNILWIMETNCTSKIRLDRAASTSIRGFLQVAIFAADAQKRSLRLGGPSLISTNPIPSSRPAARSSLAQHQRIDALRHISDLHDGDRLHHRGIDHGH